MRKRKPQKGSIQSKIQKVVKAFGCSKGQSTQSEVYAILRDERKDIASKCLNVLVKFPQVRDCFNAFNTTIERLNALHSSNIRDENLALLYSFIINDKRDELKELCKLFKCFENNIVLGNVDKCKAIVSDIESRFGISVKTIKCNILLLAVNRDYEALNNYILYLRERTNDKYLQEIIENYASYHIADDSYLDFKNGALKNIMEYIDGGAIGLAIYDILQKTPYPFVHIDVTQDCLVYFLNNNYIDLFFGLRDISLRYKTSSSSNKDDFSYDFVSLFEDVESIAESANENDQGEINLIVSLYNKENCGVIVDKYENGELKNILALSNLIAKSYIYIGKTPRLLEASVSSELILDLFNVYSLRKIKESRKNIINKIIRASGFDYSFYIHFALVKSLPNDTEKDIRDILVRIANYSKICLTPQCYRLDLDYSSYIVNGGLLSLDIHNGNSIVVKEGTTYDCKGNPVRRFTRKDNIDIELVDLLNCGDQSKLLEYAVNLIVEDLELCVLLPMQQIMDYIEKEDVCNVESVIFAYAYDKHDEEANNDKLNEKFDDFICALNIERPSEYLDNKYDLSNLELFLFKNIAKINVIDYLGCFDSTNDLIGERLDILTKIESLCELEKDFVYTETKEIIDSFILEVYSARIKNSKIYVDSESIIIERHAEIEQLINEYYCAEAGVLEQDFFLINRRKNNEGDTETYFPKKGSRAEIVMRIFRALMVDFYTHPKFGLDKNLSSEIRHGFFSNEMLSSMEEYNLLTELDEHGNYQVNQHWVDTYYMISDKIVSDVDKVLRRFCKSINSVVLQPEEWMKVSLVDKDDGRVFVIDVTSEHFQEVAELLAENSPSRVICQRIIEQSYSILNSQLEMMKNKLNNEFVNSVDAVFNKLIEELSIAKRGVSLTELFTAIYSSKYRLRENISTASDWFNVRASVEFEDLSGEDVYRIAMRCIKLTSNRESKINIYSEVDQIPGNHIMALVHSLINFINNAFKYGCSDREVRVSFLSGEGSGYKLVIENELSPQSLSNLDSSKIAAIKDSFLNVNNNFLLTTEGGSGLYKAYYELRKSSDKFFMDIDLSGPKFVVEVSHK